MTFSFNVGNKLTDIKQSLNNLIKMFDFIISSPPSSSNLLFKNETKIPEKFGDVFSLAKKN